MLFPLFSPDALRGYRLFESDDVDETRDRISSVMQPHALTPTGRHGGRSHMDFVKIGGLGLGTIAFGEEMRVEVGAVQGYHLMMFCISGHAQARARGEVVRVDQDNAILTLQGQPFDAVLSPDCEQFILRIDPSVLESHGILSTRALQPHVQVRSSRLRAWFQQLQLVASSPDLLQCVRRSPLVELELERLLVSLLALGLDPEETESKRGSISPASVKRAEEFMIAHSGDTLRLSDIATAAGVPSRALSDAFQHFMGISPMQRLRQIRLEQAAAALRTAPDGARVTEIAMRCGFVHLGRFALAYKQKFGEPPSQTLMRRRAG